MDNACTLNTTVATIAHTNVDIAIEAEAGGGHGMVLLIILLYYLINFF